MLPRTFYKNTNKKQWLYVLPLIIILGYKLFGFHLFFKSENYDIESEGNILNQLILGFVFLFAFIILLFEKDRFIKLLKANRLLVLFLIYTLLSCLWSIFPFISLKRWIQFLGIVLIGMAAMCQPSGVRNIYRIFLTCTGISLILSLIVILIHPSTPFVMENGAWNGIYKLKNNLGAACALGFTFWLPILNRGFSKKLKKLSIVILIISLILLIGSRSVTAFLSLFTIFLIFSVTKVQLPITVKLLFIPVPFVCIQLFFINFMDQLPIEYLLSTVGREMTLTGRTELWANMFAFIKEHPLLGVGYNSFWVGEAGISNIILSDLSWEMNQAHNGYVDIINELGILGFGIFIFLLTQSIVRAYAFMKRNPAAGISFFMIIICLVINNFAETSFCRISSIGWVIFIIVSVVTSQLSNDSHCF